MLLALIAMIALAAGWRLASADWPASRIGGVATNVFCVAVPAGIMVSLAHPEPWYLPVAVGIGAFVSTTVSSFRAIDDGTTNGDRWMARWRNLMRGMLMTTCIVVPALVAGDPTPWAGALWVLAPAVAYAIAWTLLRREQQPTVYAECAIGAVLGLAIVL